MQSKRWIFTINNPGDWRPAMSAAILYTVCQLERGAEGTEHLQGYVRFKTNKKLPSAKEALGNNTAHMETAKGTEEHNKTYCTKEETRIAGPWEFGTYQPDAGKQGHRTDIEALRKSCIQGATMRELALEHTDLLLRHPAGVALIRQAVRAPVPKERQMFVHILWGATGTGKTHRVRMHFGDEDLFVVRPGRGPWDNYEGQAVVLFDEFDYNKWPIQDMLMLLDKWRVTLDCRYQNKEAAWVQVFILGNTDPDGYYQLELPALLQAFRRRVHRITEVMNQEQVVDLSTVTPSPPDSPAAQASQDSAASVMDFPRSAPAAKRSLTPGSDSGEAEKKKQKKDEDQDTVQ